VTARNRALTLAHRRVTTGPDAVGLVTTTLSLATLATAAALPS